MRLTAAAILALADRKIVDVEVPEWGTTVSVRTLSGAERDAFEYANYLALKDGKTAENITARGVSVFACNEDGTPLFTLDQAEALGAKNSAALRRIYDAGSELNAIEQKDVDAIAKNSEPSPAEPSTSV